MNKRVYIQSEDVIYESQNILSKGTYVDSPNLTLEILNSEVSSSSSTLQDVALKHTISLLTSPSSRAIAERNRIVHLLDDFCSFTWDGVHMFENFGAFIVTSKTGDLKLYNGPSFKNEYAKQQFQDGYTNISGITFETQKISFTMGVYWFSIEDYRILMNFLHPYKVATLFFDFESEYGYQCKLSSIKDSSRYVVGKETISDTDTTSTDVDTNTNHLKRSRIIASDQEGYRYYTELQLTFEVIGEQCAKSQDYSFIEKVLISPDGEKTFQGETGLDQGETVLDQNSDLPMPFQISLKNLSGTANNMIIQCFAQLNDDDNKRATLFSIELKNLNGKNIDLRYDSEQGLIYISLGDKEQILSLFNIADSGARIVNSLIVKQFFWPGILDYPDLKDALKQIILIYSGIGDDPFYFQYLTNKRTNVL